MQTINIGTNPNDGSGDALRDAFDKVNTNFTEIEGFLDSQVTTEQLNTALSGYATTSDFSGYVSTVDGKANTVHYHVISDMTGLQDALDSKVSASSFNTSITSLNSSISSINSTISGLNVPLFSQDTSGTLPDNSYLNSTYGSYPIGSRIWHTPTTTAFEKIGSTQWIKWTNYHLA